MIAFESRSSSALVWQVPTPNGPFVVDPTLDWVRECERPPAETGEGRGTWVEEEHDLRADFARLVPRKQAGRVLRLHLMTDSDNTGGHVAATYADIRFVRPLRMRPSLDAAVIASPAPKRQ